MFTGIIEETGEIKSLIRGDAGGKLAVRAPKIAKDISLGDSVAVNGVCLTASEVLNDGFTADVMGETMRRSNLSRLKPGDRVNLERAIAAGGRFGGHIVSGHIDCEGVITGRKKEDNAVWIEISAEKIMKYVVEKGSVAVDGISLTVAHTKEKSFAVSIIPHTGAETALLSKRTGDSVNLEADIIGKYVEKLLKFDKPQKKEITAEFLAENGFLA